MRRSLDNQSCINLRLWKTVFLKNIDNQCFQMFQKFLESDIYRSTNNRKSLTNNNFNKIFIKKNKES